MTSTYVQPGATIDHVAASAISSGDVVVIGNILGVALADIASGATGSVAIEGVYDLPKVTAAVIAAGEMVMYDVSTAKFDDNAATPATGDVTNAAIAVEAGTSSMTKIKVKLNVSPGTVA